MELWQNATHELESLQEIERVWSVKFSIVTGFFFCMEGKTGHYLKIKTLRFLTPIRKIIKIIRHILAGSFSMLNIW